MVWDTNFRTPRSSRSSVQKESQEGILVFLNLEHNTRERGHLETILRPRSISQTSPARKKKAGPPNINGPDCS